MRIHGFALLLLLGSTTLAATPPDASSSAAELDVDAMARAKDVKTGGPDAAPAPRTDPVPTADVPGDIAPSSAPQAPDFTPSAGASDGAAPQDRLDTDPATSQPPADEAAADDAAPAADAGTAETTEPPGDASAPEKTDAPAEPAAADAASAERRRADACVARAGTLLDAAQAHDYDKATRDFDAKMRSALPAAKFQQAWESLAQFGKLTARGQSHPGSHDGYVVVTIPLVFEKANLYAQVSCGSDGRIAGFYVKPLQLPAK